MSDFSIAEETPKLNEDIPPEVTEHISPPPDKSGLVAWLRLRAEHHARLAETRPWATDYHERMAASALDCADFHEHQAEKAEEKRRGGRR